MTLKICRVSAMGSVHYYVTFTQILILVATQYLSPVAGVAKMRVTRAPYGHMPPLRLQSSWKSAQSSKTFFRVYMNLNYQEQLL